jgi:hypothetical protein
MSTPADFPHLHLNFSGAYEPHFQSVPREDSAVKANKSDRVGHATRLRGILDGMRRADAEIRRLRAEMGLPAIPRDRGFLLRLPKGVDADVIVHALGVELVAETEEGLMLVSSVDIQFSKLEEVLNKFALGKHGGGSGASWKIFLRPKFSNGGRWPMARSTLSISVSKPQAAQGK